MFTQTRKKRKLQLQDTSSGMWHTMRVVESDMKQKNESDVAIAASDQRPIYGASQSTEYDATSISQRQRGISLWNETYQARQEAAAQGTPTIQSTHQTASMQQLQQHHTPIQATTVRRSDGRHTSPAAAAATSNASATRTYLCRYSNCGKMLSSSSNRARHERMQHKGEEMNLPILFSQLVVPTAYKMPPHIRSSIDYILRDQRIDTAAAACVTESNALSNELIQTRTSDIDPSASSIVDHGDEHVHLEGQPSGVEGAAVEDAIAEEEAVTDAVAMRLNVPDVDNMADTECDSSQLPANLSDVQELSGSTEDVGGADDSDPLRSARDQSEALQKLVRPLMEEADLQNSFFPFLNWLTQPPITSVEALVKARRVSSDSQLQPIKLNLRFMYGLLYERELIDNTGISPIALARISNCQALYQALVERQAGSSRIHVLFLLVKKILVFLSSHDSVKNGIFTLPSSIESYMYVENICAEHGARRKQETRNRAVLGAATSNQLQRQLLQDHPGSNHRPRGDFSVPTTWNASDSSSPLLVQRQRVPAAAAAAAAAPPHVVADLNDESDASSTNSLSKDELRKVSRGCLAYLNAALSAPSEHVPDSVADGLFISYLITGTLCFGLAPRSQVLKQLQIGTSFVKNAADGKYWIRMLAEQSKNGKPTAFALPLQMTRPYDHYLSVVRPRVLGRLAFAEAHTFVFFKRTGQAPRTDFSSHTNAVTLRILGRPVNAHAFRAAVITAFYETGASQTQMNTLADVMAHDPETARNFYYRPQFARASVETNDAMVDFLLK